MNKCKYEVDFMNNFKALPAFLDVLENAEVTFKNLYDRVGELDKATNDMLHDFEFDKFYRTEGHRKARQLKAIRQERRAAKNTMELLYPLKEFARNNRSLRSAINKLMEEIEKVAEKQEVRVYEPRILEKSPVAGQHFDTNVMELANCRSVRKKRK